MDCEGSLARPEAGQLRRGCTAGDRAGRDHRLTEAGILGQ